MIREERFCAEMVERVQSAQEEAEARGWGLASPSPGYKGREHSRPVSAPAVGWEWQAVASER